MRPLFPDALDEIRLEGSIKTGRDPKMIEAIVGPFIVSVIEATIGIIKGSIRLYQALSKALS